ncbi:MAG: GIY-YIG nuclease family protein [Gammaproteobacteria bacterium]|nr:GIY-YIG nuclease family protein [Gammaproteobacteria bacterium]
MNARARHWYVYLLECRGGRLYAGITTDVERRLREHRAGKKGARFTRAHPPVRIVAAVRVASRAAALRLEAAVRKLRRAQKLRWAAARGIGSAWTVSIT